MTRDGVVDPHESGWDANQTIETATVPAASGGSPEKDAAPAIMQQQLGEVGIKTEILSVDATELNTRYIQENNFDVFYNAGGVFLGPTPRLRHLLPDPQLHPNGGNGSHYSNPTVDDLFTQGVATTDLAERKRIYTELAVILNEELPWIYLWSSNSLYAVNNRLQGFRPQLLQQQVLERGDVERDQEGCAAASGGAGLTPSGAVKGEGVRSSPPPSPLAEGGTP